MMVMLWRRADKWGVEPSEGGAAWGASGAQAVGAKLGDGTPMQAQPDTTRLHAPLHHVTLDQTVLEQLRETAS